MTIECVNKDVEGEYMGRGSILGNPFYMRNEKMRDEVCDKFYTYFADRVNNDFPPFMKELERLINIWLDKGELRLQCFCKPKRCHTDTIREYLVWELNNRGYTVENGVQY